MSGGRVPILNGVRVLDLTHVLAGPYCTRILADLGADVVRVESSTRPDRLGIRNANVSVESESGRAPLQVSSNRSKRSVALNLKAADALAIAHRLVESCDVIVENFSSGVMDRLGLGWEVASDLNPRVVYASMSGYGKTGPLRGWRSMNMNTQAHAGLMMATGREGDEPTAVANSWADYIAGLGACLGILAALKERSSTGQGKAIDCSQFEWNAALLGPALVWAAHEGAVPPRRGNRSALEAIDGCYRCRGDDQWCTISIATDEQWNTLVEFMGVEALHDPRFSTPESRLRHQDLIDQAIGAWTARQPAESVKEQLEARGITAAVVRDATDVMRTSGGSRAFVNFPADARSVPIATTLPFRFSQRDVAPLRPAPRVGQNTHEVLREWIGMDEESIDGHVRTGVLI